MKKSGQDKEYYYVRTHLSNSIFALEKNLIDSLELDKMTDVNQTENSGEKIE